MQNTKSYYLQIVTIAISILLISVILLSFTGNLPPKQNPYNTYTLQAQSWLSGRLDLGKYYNHLEIAEYKGKYYSSFPPFPSFVMLPFVLLFDINTPDSLISIVIAILGAVYAFKIAIGLGKEKNEALFWSLFVTLGSNFVFVMSQGWVWFIAQTMAFTLSMASLYYANNTKKYSLSFFLWACAVGCRPFTIIYLPFLIYLMSEKGGRIKHLLKCFIPAATLGLIYMILNYLRFDNPFEFGHNFLPEFLEDEKGQFSVLYMLDNLKSLVRLPEFSEGFITLPAFDGFAFYLASPIFITYIIYLFKIKKPIDLTLLILLIINILLLTAHKTMGGWQFGNRYTIDLLPFVFIGIMRLTEGKKFSILNIPLMIFGLALNVYGTIALLNRIIA